MARSYLDQYVVHFVGGDVVGGTILGGKEKEKGDPGRGSHRWPPCAALTSQTASGPTSLDASLLTQHHSRPLIF